MEHSDDGQKYHNKGNQVLTYTVGEYTAPIMVKHTPARLARDIYNHNQRTKFTPVMVMAMPGFGKTTFNRSVIHPLHEIDDRYSINYFQNKDILRLDQILEALPKRKPCINVFDDVSFILESLREAERIKILDRLSRVREVIDPEYKETPSILFMDYHYSYAMPKTFRQSNFKVYISVTDEERENYLKQMGYQNRDKIKNYISIFISMMRFGRFYVINPTDGSKIWYKTDQPFRPALVSNYGELHITLFHKINNCEKCAFRKTFDKPNPDFWGELTKKYPVRSVKYWLRIYAYMNTGRKRLLHKNDRAILQAISDHHKQSKIDMIGIYDLLKSVDKAPKAEQEALFRLGLEKMEGRNIRYYEEEKKAIRKSRQEAEEMEKVGSPDTVSIGTEEEADDEGEELDLTHSVAQLAGSYADDEEDDFSDEGGADDQEEGDP